MAKTKPKSKVNPTVQKWPQTVTSTTAEGTVTVNPAGDPNLTAEERLAALTKQQEAGRRSE